MQTFSTKAQLRAALLKHHRKHDHVVLVPTMGALHAGHRALLEQARKLAGEDGVVVASIFVNPIQFNNSSDLQTYPRTPEKDLEVCEGAGVDYVFSPAPEEMYSGERSIAVEESFLSATLCGASRPGHFSGVCTVLAKLFNLVQPTDAIFGKKDYQHGVIIDTQTTHLKKCVILRVQISQCRIAPYWSWPAAAGSSPSGWRDVSVCGRPQISLKI